MGHSAGGTAASEARPAGQPSPGTVRLAGMLTLSCLISPTGQTTVTFAGELDPAGQASAGDAVTVVAVLRGCCADGSQEDLAPCLVGHYR